MDMCLLCLELRKCPHEGVHVESSQWREENIEKIIEKHFWSMKTITTSAWLCAACWHIVREFHLFHTRIENAHAYFTTILKTEMQDIMEFDETALVKDLAPVADTLQEVHYDLEQPINQEQFEPSPPSVSSDEEEKLIIIKKENTIEDQEPKDDTTNEMPARRKSKRSKDPLEKLAVAINKVTNKKLTRKCRQTRVLKQENNVSDSNDVKDFENHADVYSDNEEKSSPSNPYYKPCAKYRSQDEFVGENFKIVCGICQLAMPTFHEVCKHSANEHKRRGFVTCCNKKFFRRSILVEHIHWHLDPEYFKCKDCGKVMADRRCLEIHARVHQKLDRTHICDECGKAFARALALQRHKLIHLPDEEKKYSCDQCGKNFGDNNLLSNHVRSVHQNKYVLVCELCGRRMHSKDVFERHMLRHEGRPIPTISCDVCGLKMTDPRGLKRHKEIQHPEGGRIEYKCHICSKISPTLKAHKKHVQYKHVLGYDFKCTVCEKAFKRAISLTEHMATHTGTVLYTCPYCPKTFNSNANMHNHRKKAHPREWEEACRAKYSGNLPPSYKPPNAFSF